MQQIDFMSDKNHSRLEGGNTLGRCPYPFCHAKRQSDVLGGWVVKNIFIMTFCETRWFQRKSHFKRKNIVSKKCNKEHTSVFHFITVFVSCTRSILNSAFVISPRQKAPISRFYSSQYVENGRERNWVIRVYNCSLIKVYTSVLLVKFH